MELIINDYILGFIFIVLLLVNYALKNTNNSNSSSYFRILLSLFLLLIVVVSLTGDSKLGFIVVIGYILMIINKGKIEYYDLKISKKIIESDLIDQNIRILYITDFQFDVSKKRFNHRAMKNVLDKANAIDYDLLLLGGDFINYAINIDLFMGYLKELRIPSMGAYAVLGNHDYVDYEKVASELETLGIKVMDNKKINVTDKVVVAGVDDLWKGKPVLPKLGEKQFNILLSHNPDFFNDIPEDNEINCMLSGHYHAGQVNITGVMLQSLITKYGYGDFYEKNINFFVSSGVGGSVFIGPLGRHIRYRAQPELLEVFVVKKKWRKHEKKR